MGILNPYRKLFISVLLLVFFTAKIQGASCPGPFDPLSADEISLAGRLTFDSYRGHRIYIITITPLEPPKFEVMRSLAEEKNARCFPRRVLVVIIQTSNGGIAAEVKVDLTAESVMSRRNLPRGTQPMITPDEMDSVDATLRADTDITERVEREGLTMDLIFFDIWVSGDKCAGHAGCPQYCEKRLAQSYVYFMNSAQDNPFAHPLNIMPIVDILGNRVIGIDELPIFPGYSRPVVEDLELPTKSHNYDPKLFPPEFFRDDIRPLTTTSHGGPSFKIRDSYRVDWQGFQLNVGFNVREGVTLHDISFKPVGQRRRQLLYRASFSEMVVPYSDPRRPYYRKGAFDVGEYGLAFDLNSLIRGVDCLPQSHMIDVDINDGQGQSVPIPNGICVSEVDGGILHRHTSDAGVTVSRAQNLVIKFTITSGNYDYEFSYILKQDGTIEIQAGLSGLLSTHLLLHGHVPWASLVADKVMAQYHQHIFCVRLDVAFDGENNTVSTLDIVPMPDDEVTNPFGTGFVTKETILDTSLNSVTDASMETNRIWGIVNENEVNRVTGRKRGYRLISNNNPLLLASDDGLFGQRAAFAKHSVWVTQYRADELYAGGKYPNQRETEDGVSRWVERDEDIRNRDIVLYHVFALNHVPVIEDFPLMGFAFTSIALKPMNFFDGYQGLHIPPPPGLDEEAKKAGIQYGLKRNRHFNPNNNATILKNQ